MTDEKLKIVGLIKIEEKMILLHIVVQKRERWNIGGY